MSVRKKAPMKTSKLVKILLFLLALAAGIAGLLRFARSRVSEQFGTKEETTYESALVTSGSISTTVSGSGTLSYEEASEITIPQSVDVTEVYVKEGQSVSTHEMLASVNSASVMKAMADVQKQLNNLDEELAELTDSGASKTITTGVAGRVKKIFAKEDDSLDSLMYEHGALMLLSLDGKMAVDITLVNTELSAGDTVTVTTSDGKEYEGSCEAVWAGKATITLSDNGPAYEDAVNVAANGTQLGKGSLYIHKSLSITGYTGKVSDIHVSENQSVAKNKKLLTLKETNNTVNYATLLSQRADLEDELQSLITIYKDGAVYSKEAGRVTAYTEAAASTSTSDATDTSWTISPTERMNLSLSVDESDILSLEIGQEASITISALGEESYSGSVTEINTNGESSNGVTTYTATISLTKEDGMLSGMSGSAVITIAGKENALLLPSDAINQSKNSYYVYTSYDEDSGEPGDMVQVVTGINNGKYTEITDGLSEGTTVYYRKSEFVSNESHFRNPGNNMPGGFPGNMPGGSDFGGSGRPSRGSGSGSSGSGSGGSSSGSGSSNTSNGSGTGSGSFRRGSGMPSGSN